MSSNVRHIPWGIRVAVLSVLLVLLGSWLWKVSRPDSPDAVEGDDDAYVSKAVPDESAAAAGQDGSVDSTASVLRSVEIPDGDAATRQIEEPPESAEDVSGPLAEEVAGASDFPRESLIGIFEAGPSDVVLKRSLAGDVVAWIHACKAAGKVDEEAVCKAIAEVLAEEADGAPLNAETHWVYDELLSGLRRSGMTADAKAEILAGAYRNSGDAVIRDYSIQHMGHLLASDGDLSELRILLEQAVGPKPSDQAGTALLAMVQAGYAESAKNGAMALVLDQLSSVGNRVTALSVAGRLGAEGVVPVAENCSVTKGLPVLLRLAGMAVVAENAPARAEVVFKLLIEDEEERVRSAATYWIAKLEFADQ